MPSFADLADRAETVSGFECRALTLRELCQLVWRFVELRELISKRQVDPARLLERAPHAVAAAIAMATNHDDGDAAEAAIEKLPFGVQLGLLVPILEHSAPGGLVPLVETLGRLAGLGSARAGPSGGVPATK
jgi:hypothetical protein